MFIRRGVLNIYSKFTGELSCQSVISIKLLCNFIEITLQHGCTPANLLHIFRASFFRNTSWWLLLFVLYRSCEPLFWRTESNQACGLWIHNNKCRYADWLNILTHLNKKFKYCFHLSISTTCVNKLFNWYTVIMKDSMLNKDLLISFKIPIKWTLKNYILQD